MLCPRPPFLLTIWDTHQWQLIPMHTFQYHVVAESLRRTPHSVHSCSMTPTLYLGCIHYLKKIKFLKTYLYSHFPIWLLELCGQSVSDLPQEYSGHGHLGLATRTAPYWGTPSLSGHHIDLLTLEVCWVKYTVVFQDHGNLLQLVSVSSKDVFFASQDFLPLTTGL